LKYTLSSFFLIFTSIILTFIFLTAIISITASLSSSYPHHYSFSHHTAFAHMPISNLSRIQDWIVPGNDIKLEFTYEPEKPIIDTFTELKFSVENTTTGDHMRDDASARVVVTKGQRLFKFENISVGDDGHFSVKYLFPDDGTHQVITRVDANNSANIASFNVFVPHQAPPSLLNPFTSSPSSSAAASDNNNDQRIIMTTILTGVISGIAIATIIVIKENKKVKAIRYNNAR
jgi:hypothetical protein